MQDLKLAGNKSDRTILNLNGIALGGSEIVLMAGPCAVESEAQIRRAALHVKQAGGKILRGGIFKPRSSPYSFQGLGVEGLDYIVEAAREHGLLTVTEVIDPQSLEIVVNKVDILQIGARNMQNFQLLKLAGQSGKPVIVKRGLAATIEEWLLAAEYILSEGNPQVILCERGIRTFETYTRNTLDLSSIAVVKSLSHLPVIVDPSHAAGRRDLISALTKAAVAAGADGLLIEMHPEPEKAKCDGAQSLRPQELLKLGQGLVQVAKAVDRTFAGPQVTEESLETLRSEIDKIDRRIIEALAERMEIVRKVADYKSIDKVKDSAREKDILHRLTGYASDLGCPAELVKGIYTLIFDSGVHCQIKSKLVGGSELSVIRSH